MSDEFVTGDPVLVSVLTIIGYQHDSIAIREGRVCFLFKTRPPQSILDEYASDGIVVPARKLARVLSGVIRAIKILSRDLPQAAQSESGGAR